MLCSGEVKGVEGDKESDERARRKQGKGAVVTVSTAGKNMCASL